MISSAPVSVRYTPKSADWYDQMVVGVADGGREVVICDKLYNSRESTYRKVDLTTGSSVPVCEWKCHFGINLCGSSESRNITSRVIGGRKFELHYGGSTGTITIDGAQALKFSAADHIFINPTGDRLYLVYMESDMSPDDCRYFHASQYCRIKYCIAEFVIGK